VPSRPSAALIRARRRDLEALHPFGERSLVLGFDDEMDVRRLDAEVHDPDRARQRELHRLANRLIDATAAQVKTAHGADHDVERLVPRDRRPLDVRFARATVLDLRAPGARPRTAVPVRKADGGLLHVGQ